MRAFEKCVQHILMSFYIEQFDAAVMSYSPFSLAGLRDSFLGLAGPSPSRRASEFSATKKKSSRVCG
jgi:hypothetical protein